MMRFLTMAHYYSNAMPPAPPPAPIRSKNDDWQALDEEAQFHVNLCLSGLVFIENLPPDARTFIRRHHPGTIES